MYQDRTEGGKARLNLFFPPDKTVTLPLIGMNMCKYIPSTDTTVPYFKTAIFDQRTGKPKEISSLVNPKYVYFHFSKVFMNLVRSQPHKWMHLPVGYNSNKTKPAMEFTKVILKYREVERNKTCLYDSVASALTYAYEHKKGHPL